MLEIKFAETPEQISEIRDLLREYTDWAFSMAADAHSAPTFQGFEQELASLPGTYAPPTGCLLLALLDDLPAGCIALKPRDQVTGELKRLYVRPTFRGKSIGRHLVAAVVAEARQIGYPRMVLDSHHSMTKAHQLYQEAGFDFVSAPVDFPNALKPFVVFMEMDLTSSS